MGEGPPKPLLQKAGELLARRSYARGELARKLRTLADTADVEAALDHLESLNLLNDADYAYNFASRRIVGQHWGPTRVRGALLRRAVPPQLIEAAIERVRHEYSDERAIEEHLQKCCGKKGYPRDRAGLYRLFLSLRRRGFSDEAIRRVLKSRVPPSAWRPVDYGE